MTNKIQAIIADDEPLAREKLRIFLKAHSDVGIIQECSTVRQTVEAVNTHRPALLFLDIQMPDGDGFDVLKEIENSSLPSVIFTTAFDQYAIRAFEAEAFDYLLKPFDEGRFNKSLKRARAKLAGAGRDLPGTPALDSLRLLRSPPARKFALKTDGRMVFLNSSEIDWLVAAGNYVRVHVGPATYQIRATIGETEAKLGGLSFLRIHRSVIVNAERIKEVRPCNSGEFIVTLRNGKELPASRSYRPNLARLLASVL